jgi:hypothetical protein
MVAPGIQLSRKFSRFQNLEIILDFMIDMNKRTLEYDIEAAGSYIEAAINCWGLRSDDKLLIT